MLIVSHEASRTGAPRVLIDVLDGLKGYERILIHRWGGSFATDMNSHADRHRYEPARRLRVTLRRSAATRRLAVPLERWAAEYVLWRERPDLVWCNTVLSASYAGPARRCGLPVVVHVHELAALAAPVLRRSGLLERGRLEGVSLVACSSAVADDLAGLTGRERRCVQVLPSCVDVAALSLIAREPGALTGHRPTRVVACGLGNRGKGLDLFVAMADRLAEQHPGGFACTWVGLIDIPIPSAAVEFVGERPDAVRFIAEADLLVLPSRSDAFPLVVLEAMSVGTPVVAFAIGGVPEQLGDTGTLVAPEDAEALADAVAALAGDPERRHAMSEAARRRVAQRWDVPGFRDRVHAMAASLLTPGPGAPH